MSSHHSLSSAAFITNIAESDFRHAQETVLSAASTTGQLLILKEGAVSVIKEGLEIATVTEAGAVFGELSVLLDQPHTADVRALAPSVAGGVLVALSSA